MQTQRGRLFAAVYLAIVAGCLLIAQSGKGQTIPTGDKSYLPVVGRTDATPTPTVTETPTPSETPTVTETPTATLTPLPTRGSVDCTPGQVTSPDTHFRRGGYVFWEICNGTNQSVTDVEIIVAFFDVDNNQLYRVRLESDTEFYPGQRQCLEYYTPSSSAYFRVAVDEYAQINDGPSDLELSDLLVSRIPDGSLIQGRVNNRGARVTAPIIFLVSKYSSDYRVTACEREIYQNDLAVNDSMLVSVYVSGIVSNYSAVVTVRRE